MVNKELKEILRSVLKEELQPIHSDIQGLKRDVDSLKSDVHEVKRDVDSLKEGQRHLQNGQEQLQKNIVQHLGDFTEKIAQHVDDQTAALNKRVFVIETQMERFTRQ